MRGALLICERVVESLIGNVGDIDQHSLPVHFGDNLLSVVGEAVVCRLVGGGVRPFVVVEMRQRHITNAKIAVDSHHADVVAQHVAAFKAHQDSNFALSMGPSNIFRGAGESQIVRILPHVFANCINLIESFLNRRRSHDAAVDPDGKENGVHAAFAHARNVDAPGGIALAKIEIAGGETLGRVVVRVEDDGGEMQLTGFLGDRVGLSKSNQSHDAKKPDGQNQ